MMLGISSSSSFIANSSDTAAAVAAGDEAHRDRNGGGNGEFGVAGTNPAGGFSDEDKGRIEFSDSGGGGGGNRWPRQETLDLLRIRSEMELAFRGSNLKGPFWEEVSRKMSQLGYKRSGKKCKEKFENVYKYHKRTKDGRASKSDGKTYRFFEQLQALENNPSSFPSLQPPPPPRTSQTQSQTQTPPRMPQPQLQPQPLAQTQTPLLSQAQTQSQTQAPSRTPQPQLQPQQLAQTPPRTSQPQLQPQPLAQTQTPPLSQAQTQSQTQTPPRTSQPQLQPQRLAHTQPLSQAQTQSQTETPMPSAQQQPAMAIVVPMALASTTNPPISTHVTVSSAPAAIPVSFSPSLSNNPLFSTLSSSQLPTTTSSNPPQGNNTFQSSHPHMPLSLPLDFTSSSTSSDEDIRRRRHKRKRKLKDLFEGLMKDMMEKQEELHNKFLETLEKGERDRMIREEAWRVQEMARMNRELDLLTQERSTAAAKDAAVIVGNEE